MHVCLPLKRIVLIMVSLHKFFFKRFKIDFNVIRDASHFVLSQMDRIKIFNDNRDNHYIKIILCLFQLNLIIVENNLVLTQNPKDSLSDLFGFLKFWSNEPILEKFNFDELNLQIEVCSLFISEVVLTEVEVKPKYLYIRGLI